MLSALHHHNNNNNNSPLFILEYTISVASLHCGPATYTKVKRICTIKKRLKFIKTDKTMNIYDVK